MRLARILGAIGRALISAGVIVLLFVGYQLWGTGLQNAQAQGNLADDFEALLSSSVVADTQATLEAVEEPAEPAPAQAEDDSDEAATETPAEEPEPEPVEVTPEFLELLYPDAGQSLARIVIPAIDVDQIIVEGVSVEDLRKGPGHYPSTPNPGQPGNASVAGHRTTYGAPFHRIDELNPGDKIYVTTVQGEFVYEVNEEEGPDGAVRGHFIVYPADTWVLGQESGDNMLTLTACHPKYSARQRIIVQATMVGEPAEAIPRDEADDFDAVEVPRTVPGEELADDAESDGTDETADAGDDLDVVIGDDVAADDDPSVDAEGNPIEGAEDTGGDQDDGAAADDAAESETDVAEEPAETAETADAADEVTLDTDSAATAEEAVELVQNPDADFGEGLNGDPTKVRPAIMWGLAGGSIWLAAWFIGQRLNRKWTMYFIGVIPFAPVLWSCFVNIDQALPSY